jgi:hypothetical protein
MTGLRTGKHHILFSTYLTIKKFYRRSEVSQQPEWKCVGHIGDRDPIAHGGGFVYEDTTGVYDPEITWFEPAPDEDWHKTEGKTPVEVYRFIIERIPEREWWYDKLDDVARSCGRTAEDYIVEASGTVMERAMLYMDLIGYFGAFEFCQYPITMTEDEAYERYAEEMKLSLGVPR